MADLSDRQLLILKHLIDEYIESAEPVGSSTLEHKYSLGISPATIRNEMVELTELGYLKQPHTSAGRIPTSAALKLYVNKLIKMKDISVSDEVGIKAKVFDYRDNYDKALREATRQLAVRTKELAVATDNNGNIFYSGTANILDMPEFYDIDLTRTVLNLLDQFDHLNSLFSRAEDKPGIHILLGRDMGEEYFEPLGMIFTSFGRGGDHRGTIGVIGPARCNYPTIIPTVQYFGNLINELV